MVRTTNADNTVNQSEFETEPCNQRQARCQARENVLWYRFWFAPDWLKEKPACCPRLLELLYRTVALSLLGR